MDQSDVGGKALRTIGYVMVGLWLFWIGAAAVFTLVTLNTSTDVVGPFVFLLPPTQVFVGVVLVPVGLYGLAMLVSRRTSQ